MTEDSRIDYVKITLLIAGLLLLALGAKGYGVFLIAGVILFGGVFVFSEIKQIAGFSETRQKAKDIVYNDSLPLSKISHLFFLIGIFESLMTIAFVSFVIAAVFYGVFGQKSLDAVLKEILQLEYLKYILIFLGIWSLIFSTHHFLKMYLQRDFKFLNILYSLKIAFTGIGGVLLTIFGIVIFFLGGNK